MTPLRAVDLCCGAGGWACAARGLPVEWVAVADLKEDCLQTWESNHGAGSPACALLNCDLSTDGGRDRVLAAISGRVDLIVGGIPCEQVSVARLNRPASELSIRRWYGLIDRCLGLVKDLDPAWWSIEDVIGLEKHLPFALGMGLSIPSRRIHAARYGPQSRVRTFLGRFPGPADPEPGPRVLREILSPGPHMTAPGVDGMRRSHRQYYSAGVVRVLDPEKPCPTILDWGGRHVRGCMVALPDGRLRRLSLAEAAAAQGFPPDYLFVAGYSRTWKMVAQAIPIYVGRAILQAIVAAHARAAEGGGGWAA